MLVTFDLESVARAEDRARDDEARRSQLGQEMWLKIELDIYRKRSSQAPVLYKLVRVQFGRQI